MPQFDLLVEDISIGLGTLGPDIAIAASNDYDASELTNANLLLKHVRAMMVCENSVSDEGPLFHMYNNGSVTTSQFAAQFMAANPTGDLTTSAGTKELWWETLDYTFQRTQLGPGHNIDIDTSLMGGKGAFCKINEGFSSHTINRSGTALAGGSVQRGHGVYNVVWM